MEAVQKRKTAKVAEYGIYAEWLQEMGDFIKKSALYRKWSIYSIFIK